MAVPWLRILDTVLRLTDLARARPARRPEAGSEALATGSRALGQLETHLAGVVVAALKEAFDRDSRRLELERAHLEAEQLRAERVLRLDLLRQAVDHEIGRLRLIAALAAASWIGTLFFSARSIGGGAVARFALGMGWALLLGAIAAAFVAQSRAASALNRPNDATIRSDELLSGASGALAPWLVIVGLAFVGLAVLIA